MGVKSGYKQTEVGIIPEDWEVKSVGELALIRTGPFGTLLKASEYSGSDGVPLISVGEVGQGRFKVTDQTPLVPGVVIRRLPQYLLRTGDIVFGRKGAVDRSAIVTDNENGWFLGSDGISIRPKVGCHPPYLACQFQRYELQSWLLQNATGTTMASLNQAILGRVQIPYAPPADQRAIAAALRDVEALLTALERLVAKKRDLKQAAMQQLLTGKTRLAGFTAEWQVKRLGEEIVLLSGQHVLAQHCNTQSKGVPYLTGPADFPQGRIKSTSWTERPGTVCAANDILITVKGSGSGTIVLADGSYGISRQLMGVRVRNGDYRFVYYSILQDATQFRANSAGLIPGLSRSDILDRPLLVPMTVEEQTAIAAALTDMDAELAALEQRLVKTRDIKQAMMQELLTGKTRLISPQEAHA